MDDVVTSVGSRRNRAAGEACETAHEQAAKPHEVRIPISDVVSTPIGVPEYVNPNCFIVSRTDIRPYKRCQYCHQKTHQCLGIWTNGVTAALFLLFTAGAVIEHVGLRFVFAVLGIVLVIVIDRKIDRETDRMLETAGRLEQALAENEVVQRQMEQQNAELDDARTRAMEASRAKSAFLANMSHELRTPLNAIIGYSELVKDHLAEQKAAEAEEAKEDVERVITSGNHLLSLINSVLDLSRAETGAFSNSDEVFDVMPLINEIVDATETLAKANGNEIKIRIADSVGSMSGDRVSISKILYNLVANAHKFTKNGVVSVTADTERRHGKEMVAFAISDTGVGISEEHQKELFKPFWQSDDSSTRSHGGAGLGLAVNHRLCEALGGVLEYTSEKGKGSTFRALIPRVSEEAMA